MTNPVEKKLQEIEQLCLDIMHDYETFSYAIHRKYGKELKVDGINLALIESSANNMIIALKKAREKSSKFDIGE